MRRKKKKHHSFFLSYTKIKQWKSGKENLKHAGLHAKNKHPNTYLDLFLVVAFNVTLVNGESLNGTILGNCRMLVYLKFNCKSCTHHWAVMVLNTVMVLVLFDFFFKRK